MLESGKVGQNIISAVPPKSLNIQASPYRERSLNIPAGSPREPRCSALFTHAVCVITNPLSFM